MIVVTQLKVIGSNVTYYTALTVAEIEAHAQNGRFIPAFDKSGEKATINSVAISILFSDVEIPR